MTMPKKEVNSIWSRVRSDMDVDDLIFHAGPDWTASQR